MPQPPHLELRLAAALGEKRRILRVAAAGKHEVMRDQDAEFVALRVERVLLVDAPTPDAHGVDVGALRRGEQLVVTGAVHPREDRVGRRPVHALEEDFLAVDRDDERDPAVVVGFLDERDRADAETPAAPVEFLPAAVKRGIPIIQRLRAVVVRPPEFRGRHREALGMPPAAGIARDAHLPRLPRHGELALDRARLAVVVAQLDQRLELGRAVLHRHRAHKDVGDLGPVDEEERNGLPDADGDHARRDVPAVARLGLAHLQPRDLAVAPNLGRVGASLRKQRRTQPHLEPVRTRDDLVRHVHAQRRELIVVPADLLAVEINRREAVETLEQQV